MLRHKNAYLLLGGKVTHYSPNNFHSASVGSSKCCRLLHTWGRNKVWAEGSRGLQLLPVWCEELILPLIVTFLICVGVEPYGFCLRHLILSSFYITSQPMRFARNYLPTFNVGHLRLVESWNYSHSNWIIKIHWGKKALTFDGRVNWAPCFIRGPGGRDGAFLL